MFKHIAGILLVVTALGGAWWGVDILLDRSYQLAVVAPTPLYSLPPHEYAEPNPIIATLQPGQPVHVLRLRYGKDFQTFRVETQDGRVGWVVGGEGIKVLSHG